MSPIELALLIFGLMLAFMVVRVPIAGAMFIAGTIGFLIQSGFSQYSNFLNNIAYARLVNYDLSVIPLFILMGHFATQGGISKALFKFAAAVMGRFKGGLAMSAVLACGAFGAICGSSVATAATITGVALPEMKRHGKVMRRMRSGMFVDNRIPNDNVVIQDPRETGWFKRAMYWAA
ncbi:MAG: TRAP transporter large permease subunit, partial [Oxalobacteraceae bacterium]|nr:TRAP transporter large permease subunit [Oxalobacteraceae bacterium]